MHRGSERSPSLDADPGNPSCWRTQIPTQTPLCWSVFPGNTKIDGAEHLFDAGAEGQSLNTRRVTCADDGVKFRLVLSMGLLLHLCLVFYLKTRERVLSLTLFPLGFSLVTERFQVGESGPTRGGVTLISNNKNQCYDFTSNTHLPPFNTWNVTVCTSVLFLLQFPVFVKLFCCFFNVHLTFVHSCLCLSSWAACQMYCISKDVKVYFNFWKLIKYHDVRKTFVLAFHSYFVWNKPGLSPEMWRLASNDFLGFKCEKLLWLLLFSRLQQSCGVSTSSHLADRWAD